MIIQSFRQRVFPVLFPLFLFVGIFGGLIWANGRMVHEYAGGYHFLPQWMGFRHLLLRGANPYSDEAALQYQLYAYGHPAQAGEEKLRMGLPLYSLVFYLPFTLVSDFQLARALWTTLLEILLVLQVIFGIRLAKWRPDKVTLILALLFSIFSYYSMKSLMDGDAIIIVGFFVVSGLLAMRDEADEFAGVLFAFSTIKPHVVFVFLLFVLYRSIQQRRWRLMGWFFVTLILLCASSILLMPDWMIWNLRSAAGMVNERFLGSLGDMLAVLFPAMGERIGGAISAILALVLVIEWWIIRWPEFRPFLWTASLTLAVGQWLGILLDGRNMILIFPALFLVFALCEERWTRIGRGMALGGLVVMFVGAWLLFFSRIGNWPRQDIFAFLWLPPLLWVALYWVRWWAIRSQKMWFDLIVEDEQERRGM